MSRIVIVILIYHPHKPMHSINLLGLVAETQYVSCEVQNCDSYISIPSSQTYRSYYILFLYKPLAVLTKCTQASVRMSNVQLLSESAPGLRQESGEYPKPG
jgi:hypothetical protein